MFHLTAITHRHDYVWTSFISQVTPSESSVIKKVGFEPMIKGFLPDTLGVPGVTRVVMQESLVNLRKVIFVQFAYGTKQTEVWRALKGVASSARRSERSSWRSTRTSTLTTSTPCGGRWPTGRGLTWTCRSFVGSTRRTDRRSPTTRSCSRTRTCS